MVARVVGFISDSMMFRPLLATEGMSVVQLLYRLVLACLFTPLGLAVLTRNPWLLAIPLLGAVMGIGAFVWLALGLRGTPMLDAPPQMPPEPEPPPTSRV